MWYIHESRISAIRTGQPVSSSISLARHSSGVSPISILPPGSSHSSRSLRNNSTRPSRMATPLGLYK
ncbi:hypothetical protein BJF83_21720 [Nocardiopsis sp. CNR-923]|nr:hypothetical protein BJF83_21720 [Nocardiopsis sp. CNR-923]